MGPLQSKSCGLHVRLIVCSFPQQPFGLTGAAQDPKGQQPAGGGEKGWEVLLIYRQADELISAVPHQNHYDPSVASSTAAPERTKECPDVLWHVFNTGNLERECMEEICDHEEAREVFEQQDTTVPPCSAPISSQRQENWIQQTNLDSFSLLQAVFWTKYLGEHSAKFKVYNRAIHVGVSSRPSRAEPSIGAVWPRFYLCSKNKV